MLFARHEQRLREGYGESTLFAPPRTGGRIRLASGASGCAATRRESDVSGCYIEVIVGVFSSYIPISTLKNGEDDGDGGSGGDGNSGDGDDDRTSDRARRCRKGRQGAQWASAPG